MFKSKLWKLSVVMKRIKLKHILTQNIIATGWLTTENSIPDWKLTEIMLLINITMWLKNKISACTFQSTVFSIMSLKNKTKLGMWNLHTFFFWKFYGYS